MDWAESSRADQKEENWERLRAMRSTKACSAYLRPACSSGGPQGCTLPLAGILQHSCPCTPHKLAQLWISQISFWAKSQNSDELFILVHFLKNRTMVKITFDIYGYYKLNCLLPACVSQPEMLS